MDAVQVPTNYADLKVKENVQNGKSWRKDISGLEIIEKQIFNPLKYILICQF